MYGKETRKEALVPSHTPLGGSSVIIGLGGSGAAAGKSKENVPLFLEAKLALAAAAGGAGKGMSWGGREGVIGCSNCAAT
eukprot:1142927-Pelagomonas_calceolata.AAC.4